MIMFIIKLLTLAGIVIAPCFTLSAVLWYFGHPILAIIAFIFSIIRGIGQ